MKNLLTITLLAGLLFTASARAGSIEMTVDGLVCAFCAQGIDKSLRKDPATADVFVSLEKKLVAVSLNEGQDISDETLRTLLTKAGYTLREVRRSDESLEAIKTRAQSGSTS